MVKGEGGKPDHRLADMAIRPQPSPTYSPPPDHICNVTTFPAELTQTDTLHVRIKEYKGKIVDFALQQMTCEEGVWRQVARIDCCHGTIHRHQFVSSTGEDVYDHRTIRTIPHDSGRAVVDEGYPEAYDVMFNEWEDNLRRWRDG